jgi:ParB family chromosome partitioning protein
MSPNATDTAQVQYLDLKPSLIAQHPDNPRRDVGDISDLTASAKERGILEPLIVAPAYDGMTKSLGKAEFLLIAGHRRLAAAKKARLSTVPVVLRNDWTSRGDQVSAMLIENLHRADLSPIEEGEGYQLVMEVDGLTQAKVADRVQQPAKRVRDRVKLVKLPKGVQDRIHDGQVTLTEAIEAAAFASDGDTMARLEKAAGTRNFAVELEAAKARRKAEQDWRSLLKQIRDAGYVELEPVKQDPAAEPGTRVDGARQRRSIPGLGGGYAWRLEDAWAEEKRLHADCPHRAVVITDESSPGRGHTRGLEFLCTKPEVHAAQAQTGRDNTRHVVDTSLPETDEERAARQAQEAARAEQERDRADLQSKLDAAATVRRRWVSDVLHHKTGDVDLAKRLLLEHARADWTESNIIGCATSIWERGALLAWLRIDEDVPGEDVPAVVSDKLNKLTLPALAMLTRIVWFADVERGMTEPHREWPATDEDVDWFRILTDEFAYPWSDFERDHFGLDADGHVPSVTEEDDADVPADDGDAEAGQ